MNALVYDYYDLINKRRMCVCMSLSCSVQTTHNQHHQSQLVRQTSAVEHHQLQQLQYLAVSTQQQPQHLPYYTTNTSSEAATTSGQQHFKSPALLPLHVNHRAQRAAPQLYHHPLYPPQLTTTSSGIPGSSYYYPQAPPPSSGLGHHPKGGGLAATTMDGGHNPLRLNTGVIYEENNHVSEK